MILDKTSTQPDALRDKVAVVTGAGQGIGKETSRILARLGACVVIAEVNESGREVERLIQAEGGRALFVPTDVSDAASMQELGAYVHRQMGQVSILINNAEANWAGAVLDHSVEEWDHVIGVNLRGAFLGIKTFLPDMLERKEGVVVTMQSAEGMPYMSAYLASKVAVRSLALSLAAELGEQSGVVAFCFGPGIVDTPGARAAFRRLAPLYGLTEEQFIQQSGLPLISAELCATGLVGTILYAHEFHGNGDVLYVHGLSKLGLDPQGELWKTEVVPASTMPVPAPALVPADSPSVVELNRRFEDILRVNLKEFNDFPIFMRPVIKRMFQQSTGMKVEDWLEHAQDMTRRLDTHSLDAPARAKYRAEVERMARAIGKQEADARGRIKDPRQLEEALKALREREETVNELAAALGAEGR